MIYGSNIFLLFIYHYIFHYTLLFFFLHYHSRRLEFPYICFGKTVPQFRSGSCKHLSLNIWQPQIGIIQCTAAMKQGNLKQSSLMRKMLFTILLRPQYIAVMAAVSHPNIPARKSEFEINS